MKKAIVTITSWVNDLSDLLKSLLVMGILIGLVYNDMFGVIGNIGKLMSNIGDGDIFNIKFQKKPLMIWIWFSAFLIALGSLHRLFFKNV